MQTLKLDHLATGNGVPRHLFDGVDAIAEQLPAVVMSDGAIAYCGTAKDTSKLEFRAFHPCINVAKAMAIGAWIVENQPELQWEAFASQGWEPIFVASTTNYHVAMRGPLTVAINSKDRTTAAEFAHILWLEACGLNGIGYLPWINFNPAIKGGLDTVRHADVCQSMTRRFVAEVKTKAKRVTVCTVDERDAVAIAVGESLRYPVDTSPILNQEHWAASCCGEEYTEPAVRVRRITIYNNVYEVGMVAPQRVVDGPAGSRVILHQNPPASFMIHLPERPEAVNVNDCAALAKSIAGKQVDRPIITVEAYFQGTFGTLRLSSETLT